MVKYAFFFLFSLSSIKVWFCCKVRNYLERWSTFMHRWSEFRSGILFSRGKLGGLFKSLENVSTL